MTLQQKFNEYIASGDPIISISDEQRDWILPFIERCVGEERASGNLALENAFHEINLLQERINTLTQEDKIK